MIWVTRPDGYCTYLNKPWYDYTGQTGEESQGLGWLSATHPDDAKRSAEVFLAANGRQEPFSLLYRLRRRDGVYRWCLDKGEPKFDPLGQFEGYVGVVIDVHEQRLAEERFQLSVKAGQVGIWEWDTVHNRATYSLLLREMFGLETGKYEGEFENAYQVYQSVVHSEDWPEVDRRVSKALRNQEASFYVEFRAVKPSGEITWIAERGQVIFEGGQAVRMNGTCIDITDRKRAEQEAQRMSEELAALNEEMAASNEELRAANEELGHSNRRLASINADLDTFVYTASHDLKSPILNIEGLLKAMERQMNQQTRAEKNVQQIYQLLYGSVARFKSTIRDLTEVARAGKDIPEDADSIPLAGVLAEVCQDLAPQIAEAGARIEEELDCSRVYFSKKNLKSVLYNLLSNAVKYRSPDRPLHVRITCYELATHHVLSVEDNGLGMDMRQEEKIFALFKRLHNHVEGTGIGLYIVKKMLENAGGGIEVESQVGVGSTFRVYLKR
jgi:PAS domain S-box-containing protein